MMSSAKKLIVLASGGTGGHVFPAQALAEELQRRGYSLALITDSRGDAYSGPLGQIDTHTISAAAMSGRGKFGVFTAVFKLALGFWQANKLLKQLKPDAVVGFGGYPSVPTMLAATRLPLKTVIHEQNAVLGRANRLLASRVKAIATSFPITAGIKDDDEEKVTWTGNPVRPEIAALSGQGYQEISDQQKIHILIVGGSQGAAIFGEILPRALASLPEPLKARIFVTQQVREEQMDDVKKLYAASGVEYDLRVFLSDMPAQIKKSHLVICRAGASTMAEITTAGRPSILVPYQYAVDDHQSANAARLCDAAGAWMIPQVDFSVEALSNRLCELFENPHLMSVAAASAAKQGKPEATQLLADVVCDLIEGKVPSKLRSNLKETAA